MKTFSGGISIPMSPRATMMPSDAAMISSIFLTPYWKILKSMKYSIIETVWLSFFNGSNGQLKLNQLNYSNTESDRQQTININQLKKCKSRLTCWFSILGMILMFFPFSAKTFLISRTPSASRMKEAKTISTSCILNWNLNVLFHFIATKNLS